MSIDATGATAPSITIEDIKEWRGQDVVDPQGEKLGKLDEVYYDTETDAPAFAAVKSGTLSKHLTLVPLAGATAGQSYVRVSVGKDRFKDAPSFEPDAELTPGTKPTPTATTGSTTGPSAKARAGWPSTERGRRARRR